MSAVGNFVGGAANAVGGVVGGLGKAIGGLFDSGAVGSSGGASAGMVPPPPAPIAPPTPAPAMSSPNIKKAQGDVTTVGGIALPNMGGTLLTGPQGLVSPANTGQKTLLGA